MKNKKAFLPQVLGLEIHYLLIGIVVGVVATIILFVLGRTGVIPISLCKLVCGAAK
ncbi:MAG: hypothetical protein V1859_05555 [archaeon]